MAKKNNTNIAKVEDGLIHKINASKTSGNNSTKGQIFYSNYHLNHTPSQSESFEYDIPRYSADTAGTLNFTGQEKKSVFEVFNRAQLTMGFSANTESFTASTYVNMSHDIYKISYSDLLRYRKTLSEKDFNVIKKRIQEPYVSYTAATSIIPTLALSGQQYVFSPEQVDKPAVGYSEEVFEDRAMYFFNTRHSFIRNLGNYESTFSIEGEKVFYNNSVQVKTDGDVNKIEAGPWSGFTAKGMFFTCFYPPSAPIIQAPRPESYSSSTFSPEFYFSNVSDGDEYVVEITYSNDNSDFSINSATSQYFYAKDETEFQTRRVANKESSSFTSETTRRASVPLIPDSTYWYRVGNVKFIENIFGVRQSVISYTDSFSATSYGASHVTYTADSDKTSEKLEQHEGGNPIPELPPYTPQK